MGTMQQNIDRLNTDPRYKWVRDKFEELEIVGDLRTLFYDLNQILLDVDFLKLYDDGENEEEYANYAFNFLELFKEIFLKEDTIDIHPMLIKRDRYLQKDNIQRRRKDLSEKETEKFYRYITEMVRRCFSINQIADREVREGDIESISTSFAMLFNGQLDD